MPPQDHAAHPVAAHAMTVSVFAVVAGTLVSGMIALALRAAHSSRTGWKRTRSSEESRGASIPERVRRSVWQRDRGACVVCGTHQDLRFERVITIGRAGWDSVRNLELRCASCQRLKAPRDETERSPRASSGLAATGDIGGLVKARGQRW